MRRIVRVLLSLAFGAAALWYGCVLPLTYEIELARLERATLAAIRTVRPEDAGILARQTLERARRFVSWHPEDVRLAMIEGANQRFLGNPAGAVSAYERALRFDRRPEIYLNLAFAEREMGRLDTAARHLAIAIRFSPEMAADVADPELRRRAVAVLRRHAIGPPFCCATDFDRNGRAEVLEVRGDSTKTVPSSPASLSIANGWSPETAWVERGQAILLVRRHDRDAEVQRLGSRGEVISRQSIRAIPELWRAVCGGPFGAGGSSALLLSNTVTGDAKVRSLEGPETEETVPLLEEDAYVATCADFSRDGEIDALYRSFTGRDYILLLKNMRKESFVAMPSAGFQREIVAAADFTSDGATDLLWYDFEIDRLLLWEMDDRYALRRISFWP